MVSLHNDDAPQLRNYDFMVALCQRFEDPLAECKTQTWMKTITQGWWSVPVYTQEFRELACWLATWLKDILIVCFKDGLNDDIYHICISHGAPHFLQHWYVLVDDVEIDQDRDRD